MPIYSYKILIVLLTQQPYKKFTLMIAITFGIIAIFYNYQSKANNKENEDIITCIPFTDSVLKVINEKRNNVVFILWGRKAQEKCNFIDANTHLLLESAHPSPFSANNGFFGSKPFSKTNNYLKQKNIEPIEWQL